MFKAASMFIGLSNTTEHASFREKEKLTILVPGCGSFPSGEEFLSMLLRNFSPTRDFEIWLFEPNFFQADDRRRIEELAAVFDGTNKKLKLNIREMGLKKFFKQYPNVKADMVYLEHPDVAIFSAFSSEINTLRYELPYLNKLMNPAGCLILTTHRIPIEAEIIRNLLQCFAKEIACEKSEQAWRLGHYLRVFSGSGSHMKDTCIMVKPRENLDVNSVIKNIREYDQAFVLVCVLSVALSIMVKPVLYDEAFSSHFGLSITLSIATLFSYELAGKYCMIEKESRAPLLFFVGSQIAAHALACAVKATMASP